MTNRDLINKIKVLKEIRPDKEWKESNRVVLMSQCRRSDADQYAEATLKRSASNQRLDLRNISDYWRLFRFRPAMVTALVIIFTITGCAYGLNISQKSLPGDMFWNVKVSLEKAQVGFSSGEKKVKLETEFAGKRLEELKIVSQNGDEESVRTQKVAQAVENLKGHIDEAKKGMSELSGQSELSELSELRKETYAAITAVEDEYEVWMQDLIEGIEKNIAEVQEGNLTDNETVNSLVEEVKNLLAEGKLGDGGKLVKAKYKILEAKEILEAEGELKL